MVEEVVIQDVEVDYGYQDCIMEEAVAHIIVSETQQVEASVFNLLQEFHLEIFLTRFRRLSRKSKLIMHLPKSVWTNRTLCFN